MRVWSYLSHDFLSLRSLGSPFLGEVNSRRKVSLGFVGDQNGKAFLVAAVFEELVRVDVLGEVLDHLSANFSSDDGVDSVAGLRGAFIIRIRRGLTFLPGTISWFWKT